jgi:hypothetical protein
MPYLLKAIVPNQLSRRSVAEPEILAGDYTIRSVNGNRESLIKRCSKRFVRVSREI